MHFKIKNAFPKIKNAFPKIKNAFPKIENPFPKSWFTVNRLHRLTDYKESSPEGLSILNMLPPSRLNLILISLN